MLCSVSRHNYRCVSSGVCACLCVYVNVYFVFYMFSRVCMCGCVRGIYIGGLCVLRLRQVFYLELYVCRRVSTTSNSERTKTIFLYSITASCCAATDWLYCAVWAACVVVNCSSRNGVGVSIYCSTSTRDYHENCFLVELQMTCFPRGVVLRPDDIHPPRDEPFFLFIPTGLAFWEDSVHLERSSYI